GEPHRVAIDDRAVVHRLSSRCLPCRPLRFAPGWRTARRHAEAARDEVLVEQRKARRQAGNAQRCFHRGGPGTETDGGFDVPDLRMLLRPYGVAYSFRLVCY